eukprot:m51a1_g2441 hypothetical protein (738) ;mRNA; r:858227-860509
MRGQQLFWPLALLLAAPAAAATSATSATSWGTWPSPLNGESGLDGRTGSHVLPDYTTSSKLSRASQYASVVASVGDVDGDGLGDYVVTAPRVAGLVYLHFGRQGPWARDVAHPDVTLYNRAEAEDSTGCSVSGRGDLNGDGVADFVIGAQDAGSADGRAYVVFGRPRGRWPTTLDLSLGQASGVAVLESSAAGAPSLWGRRVAVVGDINGDGLADLAVGARSDEQCRVTVVFGMTGPWPSSANVKDLRGLVMQLPQSTCRQELGHTVGGGGDVNGDGIDDLVLGTYSATFYVVWGRRAPAAWPAELAAGKEEALGYATIGHPWPTGSSDHVASFDANVVGDVNGDGLADIGVSVYRSPSPHNHYVVMGRRQWPAAGRSVDFTTDNATTAIAREGLPAGCYCRSPSPEVPIARAGDVNADGVDDVVLGWSCSVLYCSSQSWNRGGAKVVLGRRGAWPRVLPLDADGVLWVQTAASSGWMSASGGSDLNGDGVADIVVGENYCHSGTGCDSQPQDRAYVVFPYARCSGLQARAQCALANSSCDWCGQYCWARSRCPACATLSAQGDCESSPNHCIWRDGKCTDRAAVCRQQATQDQCAAQPGCAWCHGACGLDTDDCPSSSSSTLSSSSPSPARTSSSEERLVSSSASSRGSGSAPSSGSGSGARPSSSQVSSSSEPGSFSPSQEIASDSGRSRRRGVALAVTLSVLTVVAVAGAVVGFIFWQRRKLLRSEEERSHLVQ